MDKRGMLNVVNIVLFFSFCVQAVSGFLLFWEVPELVALVHKANAVLFAVSATAHMRLNRQWLRALIAHR